MAATAYLLKLPNSNGTPSRTLRDNVDAIAVNANSQADAVAFAKSQYGDDVNAMWDVATASIPVAGTNLAGWKARIRVVSPLGALVADVTVDADDYAAAAIAAAATLTNDGTNVTDADTVTIGGKVYTFQDTLTNVDGNVKIGASNTATMTNLFNAINASGGTPGTDYAAATTANTQVVATNPSGTTVVVTALAAGAAGNLIAVSEASTHLAWSGATLVNGVDAQPTIDSVAAGLVIALNATSEIAGAAYNSSTQVLRVADTTDVLGDHRVFPYFIPVGSDPNGLVGVPGVVTSITQQGVASAALSVTLAADNYVIPSVLALLGEVVI